MRMIRTGLAIAMAAGAVALTGISTPAQACEISGQLGTHQCGWVATCSLAFAGDHNVDGYRACLDVA